MDSLGTMIMMFALINALDSVLYLGAAPVMADLMLRIGFAGYSAISDGLASKATCPTEFSVVNQ